jgi:hypothetical protein
MDTQKITFKLGKWIVERCGCKSNAEWELCENEPYKNGASCTKHVSDMITDGTVSIVPLSNSGPCCHINALGQILIGVLDGFTQML